VSAFSLLTSPNPLAGEMDAPALRSQYLPLQHIPALSKANTSLKEPKLGLISPFQLPSHAREFNALVPALCGGFDLTL
jgi:hypothetical protein